MAEIFLIAVVFTGFLVAFLAPFIQKAIPRHAGTILTLIPLSKFLICLWFIPIISNGNHLKISIPWFPLLGINLDFYLDGLSLLFSLLISGVGTMVVFYASAYLKGHPKQGNFYCYLFIFMSAMLGLVLADNMVLMFVFWELTSVSSFLLIGFNHEKENSRYSALQALLVTGGGGLAMLAGMITIGAITGEYSISGLSEFTDGLHAHAAYTGIVLLIFAGTFTKSAQFPFHFWLPNAMAAPTPVSAYLHSATMVKAGVYFIARLNPLIGGTDLWQYGLLIFGGTTMLIGAMAAVKHDDLKKILAYTTVSSLGILVFLIGIGTKFAYMAAIGFLIVHSLYKGTLFMVAGTIDHETGTKDIRKLSGLYRYMPLLAIAALLAALSNAGIPPFLGFIGKELIYESALEIKIIGPALATFLAVATNMFVVATAIMVGFKPFAGKFMPTPKTPHEGPLALWLCPLIMGTAGLLAGIFPEFTSKYLVAEAVTSLSGKPVEVKLSLWHGLNMALGLSVLTLIGGYIIYTQRKHYKSLLSYIPIKKTDPEMLYKNGLYGMLSFAKFQTKIFQSGFLRNYILWILFMFGALIYITLINFGIEKFSFNIDLSEIYLYEIIICAVILMAAFVAINSVSMLAAIAALGIVGYGIAILFVIFGATDLAMTQLSIETLTVILFVLVIYKLPKLTFISPKKIRIRDWTIAGITGLTMCFLVLFAISEPMEPEISDYFLKNSYLLAKGKNIVNVILVDFRALDTLGEIVVLTIASVGVITLMKLRLSKTEKK